MKNFGKNKKARSTKAPKVGERTAPKISPTSRANKQKGSEKA
jgi:hypothetical protein